MEPEMACDSSKKRNELDLRSKCLVSNDFSATIPLRSVLIFLAATLATAIILEVVPTTNRVSWYATHTNDCTHARGQPAFAIYGKSSKEDHLVHVLHLLQQFGYKRTSFDSDDWDLLWAHDYPYLKMPQRMKSLRSNQIVNHFPGCGFLTNKVNLSTTTLPFLPRAFRLPEQSQDFLYYAREHPDTLFVEKHNEHRHIRIRAPHEIDTNSNDSFVQEFIQRPFLVDGYKFDIGVYVLITSVDPLRVYIYTGDVLFRYCPVQYYPFDANILDKYVVGDDYLPTWELPSLKKYYTSFGGSMRGAFDAYVRDQFKDPSVIWPQVEHIIRETIASKEQNIIGILRSYKSRNFFDLMRFDLIIDEDLKVHLMEANMSPNLSSAHYKPNALLYEQVLYSVLNLVGIGTPIHRTLPNDLPNEIEEIITAEKNLATDIYMCHKYDCNRHCNLKACRLCLPCLSGTQYENLQSAHREHLHRIDMKRIIPKPIYDLNDFDIDAETQNMTEQNALMLRWFHGKCQYERNWCT